MIMAMGFDPSWNGNLMVMGIRLVCWSTVDWWHLHFVVLLRVLLNWMGMEITEWESHNWPSTQNTPLLQIPPTVAFLIFIGTNFANSPDCLPIGPTSEHIRFFLLFSFLCFHFLVVGSVRQIKLTHVSF